MTADVEDKKSEIAKFQDQLTTQKNEVNKTQEQYDSVKNENSQLKSQLESLKADLEKKQSSSSASDDVTRLKNELEAQKKKNNVSRGEKWFDLSFFVLKEAIIGYQLIFFKFFVNISELFYMEN